MGFVKYLYICIIWFSVLHFLYKNSLQFSYGVLYLEYLYLMVICIENICIQWLSVSRISVSNGSLYLEYLYPMVLCIRISVLMVLCI